MGGAGIGGVGHGQIQQCATAGFMVVALCDVDDKLADRTAEKFPQARRYRDFRKMLADESGKSKPTRRTHPNRKPPRR